MRRVVEWEEITPELICEWAYDPDMFLMEQDEELILHDDELVPMTLPLMDDPHCPKGEIIFFTVCNYSRELMTRIPQGREALSNLVSRISEPTEHSSRKWYEYATRLLSYLEPAGPVDEEKARVIAQDLLLNPGRVGRLRRTKAPNQGWFRFTLQTSVAEHVDICAATGEFRYTPWYPLKGAADTYRRPCWTPWKW